MDLSTLLPSTTSIQEEIQDPASDYDINIKQIMGIRDDMFSAWLINKHNY